MSLQFLWPFQFIDRISYGQPGVSEWDSMKSCSFFIWTNMGKKVEFSVCYKIIQDICPEDLFIIWMLDKVDV